MAESAISGGLKKDIDEINRLFRKGISDDTFGLERLSETTIEYKSKMGFKKPDTPLYAKGKDDKERSYTKLNINTCHASVYRSFDKPNQVNESP